MTDSFRSKDYEVWTIGQSDSSDFQVDLAKKSHIQMTADFAKRQHILREIEEADLLHPQGSSVDGRKLDEFRAFALVSRLPENTEAFAELGEWHKTCDEEKLITRKTLDTKQSLKYLQRPRDPEIRFADKKDKSAWFGKLGMQVPEGMVVPIEPESGERGECTVN